VYVVINRIQVEAERAEVFEQHFGANMDRTLGEVPGLVRAALLRPNRDGDPYLATMDFETEDDFTAWRNSDAFRAAHGGRGSDGPPAGEEPAQAPPAVESYTVVNAVGS
jgi:heme oxygenase (mycobilin-producing)